MATATKIQLVEFNKDEALNGASLAFSSNGQLSGTVSDYVLNSQLNDIGSVTEKYSGQVQKKMYYFNDNGICSDGNELHNLFIVDDITDNAECWCEDCGKHTKLKEV